MAAEPRRVMMSLDAVRDAILVSSPPPPPYSSCGGASDPPARITPWKWERKGKGRSNG